MKVQPTLTWWVCCWCYNATISPHVAKWTLSGSSMRIRFTVTRVAWYQRSSLSHLCLSCRDQVSWHRADASGPADDQVEKGRSSGRCSALSEPTWTYRDTCLQRLRETPLLQQKDLQTSSSTHQDITCRTCYLSYAELISLNEKSVFMKKLALTLMMFLQTVSKNTWIQMMTVKVTVWPRSFFTWTHFLSRLAAS